MTVEEREASAPQTYAGAAQLLRDWANEPEDDVPTETADDATEGVVEEVEAEAEGSATDEEATPEIGEVPTGDAVSLDAEDAEEEPTAEASPDDAAEEPAPEQPKHYAAEVDGEEVSLSDDLMLSYKADGRDIKLPIGEVVRRAQLGENYDRRSRDLAMRQKQQEQQYAASAQQLQGWRAQAEQQLLDTTRRLLEDDAYLEELRDEYYQLTSNPQQLELLQQAMEGRQAKAELDQIRVAQQQQFSQQVWQTVDQIINEGIGTEAAPGSYRFADANEVRNRFAQAFQTLPRDQVMNDTFVQNLLAQEHEKIARVVESETRRALGSAAHETKKAVAKAVAQTTNQITDKALRRSKEAARVVTRPSAPAPQTPAKPKSYADASKKLREWASS